MADPYKFPSSSGERRVFSHETKRAACGEIRCRLHNTVPARPFQPLKYPVNSVLAGGMTDDRRTGRGRTVVHKGVTLENGAVLGLCAVGRGGLADTN